MKTIRPLKFSVWGFANNRENDVNPHHLLTSWTHPSLWIGIWINKMMQLHTHPATTTTTTKTTTTTTKNTVHQHGGWRGDSESDHQRVSVMCHLPAPVGELPSHLPLQTRSTSSWKTLPHQPQYLRDPLQFLWSSILTHLTCWPKLPPTRWEAVQ